MHPEDNEEPFVPEQYGVGDEPMPPRRKRFRYEDEDGYADENERYWVEQAYAEWLDRRINGGGYW